MTGFNPAPAILMRARRNVVAHLQAAGATSADAATPYQPARRLDRRALGFLQRRGVVHAAPRGCFWVDEDRASQWRRKTRRRIAALIGGALATTAAVFALTR